MNLFKKITVAFLLTATAATPVEMLADGRLHEYDMARKFTAPKLQNMLFSTSVDPHWTPDGDKFWYAYKTNEGTRWYIVNPATRSKKPLWDNDRMAAMLTEITHDPHEGRHLPINNLKAEKDGTFTFMVTGSQDVKPDTLHKERPQKGKEKFFFIYNPNNGSLVRDTTKWDNTRYPDWANISPDGKTVVYAKDFNLYKMSRADYEKLKKTKDDKDSTVVETPLTTFGELYFGFGMPYSYLNTDTLTGKRRPVYGAWSPDSRHFAATIEDSRKVKKLWVINSMASPRPTLETYSYEMPGDKEIPQEHLYVFDIDNNTYKEVNTHAFKDQTHQLHTRPMLQAQRDMKEIPLIWAGNNNQFFINRSSRDLHRIDVCKYVLGTDTLQPIIKERLNTYQEARPLGVVDGGKRLIQWSERNGWANLYLYDDNGNLVNPITEGPWHVHKILNIDDKLNRIYFTAMGKNKEENPYYQHLYCVNFDGTGLRELTPGEYFHTPSIDDAGRYFVDNYSRVDRQPKTALYSTSGQKVMDLEEADMSQLLANGYKYPEVFKVKAADGVTDLWGTMYKPFDFDSTKVYPIVDYVYPGPQVEGTNYPFWNMNPRTDRLAQAGFIVITVGNRGGHPDRSKWYHNYGYGNLRDYGLADQKAAIEQLANKYPYIDVNRVGIHGHSGGGFMSTAAILQYPEFFKAAVSCAGNHDNRIYNRWWSETHHGVKEKVTEQGDTTFVYSISTNPEIASRLKGHLMLVTGDIDNNVHPGNTYRVADALIRAGKRFDMLVLPQQRHGFGDMNEYFYWRLVDYFSKHLKGQQETSVDIPELAN